MHTGVKRKYEKIKTETNAKKRKLILPPSHQNLKIQS
jgi:hypothetical protein